MSKLSIKNAIIGASLATTLLLSGCAASNDSIKNQNGSGIENSSEAKDQKERASSLKFAEDYFTTLSIESDPTSIEEGLVKVGEIVSNAQENTEVGNSLLGSIGGFNKESQEELLLVSEGMNPVKGYFYVESMNTSEKAVLNLITATIAMQLNNLGITDPLKVDESGTTEKEGITYIKFDSSSLDPQTSEIVNGIFPADGLPLVDDTGEWLVSGVTMLDFYENQVNEAELEEDSTAMIE